MIKVDVTSNFLQASRPYQCAYSSGWFGLPIFQDQWQISGNGILLPKFFWSTVRKSCSSDWWKLLKIKADGREFAKDLRSLEQFIQTVKGQNNFW